MERIKISILNKLWSLILPYMKENIIRLKIEDYSIYTFYSEEMNTF